MGRGDKKTAKGKRFKGSFGNSRPANPTKGAKKTETPTEVAPEVKAVKKTETTPEVKAS